MACQNDCNPPLRFPKPISNRPSLPRIAYRIGTYSDFREALLRKLDLDPLLNSWSYRSADDPGIALMESASIVGDILTLYQEAYANELYLGTASLRDSIAELTRLIGYRLSPGVGGRATFAFEVKGSTPITIPAHFPITADVTGLPDPAVFETIDELRAIPALGKFALYETFNVPSILPGAKVFSAPTSAFAVAPQKGDRLMLIDPAGGSNPYHQVVVVDKVEQRFELTEITIQGGWMGVAVPSVTLYKLGRDFRHFGYNAPPQETVVSGGTVTQKDVSFERAIVRERSSWDPRSSYSYDPIAGPNTLPLDEAVDDISAGATFLVGADYTDSGARTFEPYVVGGVQKATLTKGSLTGASTVLALDRNILASGDPIDIRSVQIFETVSGPTAATSPRVPFADLGKMLYFFGNGVDYQALDGRTLQLQRNPMPGQTADVELIPVAVDPSRVGDPAASTLRPVLLLSKPVKFVPTDFPHVFSGKTPPVWVYGNLAVATQGKTEQPSVVGNGDIRAQFLTLAIPKKPLTYLLSNSATPPEVPELVVTVDGIEWTGVSSLVNYGPKDRVYVVREDRSGQSFIQFGDGETGAVVPSGVGNVIADYRTGTGAYGPMKPGASPSPAARLTQLDTISLLEESSGGASPEDAGHARQAAPGTIQSLGRIVSLRDYETEALSIPGVSAASAAWMLAGGSPLIALTVLMETGRAGEFAAVTEILHNYDVCRGPQRYPLLAQPGFRRYVYCDVSVALAPGYQQKNVFPQIEAALAALFSGRRFGAAEYRSRIEGVVQDVEGVLWNTVTALGDLGEADDPSTLVLPDPPRLLWETLPCGPRELLALAPAHLTLLPVAAPVKVC